MASLSSRENQQQSSKVASAAGRMGVATLLSRFAGIAREQVFAHAFGAGDAADAFVVAFRIPNLLRDLLAEGALSAAFVPQFTRALEQSRSQAFLLFSRVASLLSLVTVLLMCLAMIFSSSLVEFYTRGFHAIPGKFELTVSLTREMLPFFPLIAWAALAMGALNALGSYFIPALAPSLFNLASIFAGLIICPWLEKYTKIHSIHSMAWGVLLGGVLQWGIQYYFLLRLKNKAESLEKKEPLHLFRELFAWRSLISDPQVKIILGLLVPSVIGLAATQLSILINSIYATSFGSGAVSSLNYAFRLMQFPIGIFGVSLASALLPSFVRQRFLSIQSSEEIFLSTLRWTFLTNGLSMLAFWFAGEDMIRILFEHGAFNGTATKATAGALMFYSLGLIGYSFSKVMVPIYYALGSSRWPVAVSFMNVAANWGLNILFSQVIKAPFWSLALATALTSSLGAVLLMIRLSRSFDTGFLRRMLSSMMPLIKLEIFLSAILWLFDRALSRFFEQVYAFHSHGGSVIHGLFVATVLLALTYLLGRRFHVEEANTLWSKLQNQTKKRMPKLW